MILTRKAYRGHSIEIRSEQPGASREAIRQAQVWPDGEVLAGRRGPGRTARSWPDGEVLAAPQPCWDTQDLDHLLDEVRGRIDALHP